MLYLVGLALTALLAAGDADWAAVGSLEEALERGWTAKDDAPLAVVADGPAGRPCLEVTGLDDHRYLGLILSHELPFGDAGGGDQLRFRIHQTYGGAVTINLGTDAGHIHRTVPVPRAEWVEVALSLDLAEWTRAGEQPAAPGWGTVHQIALYHRDFDATAERMRVADFTITIDGEPLQFERPAVWDIPGWSFPAETPAAVYLGSEQAAWAIDRSTGRLAGGWQVPTRRRLVSGAEATYHVDTPADEQHYLESADTVRELRLTDDGCVAVCANPGLPGVTITKRYRANGHRLFRRTGFSGAGAGKRFLTFNNELSFSRPYRDAGYYLGAGWLGPLVPAPKLIEPRKVTEYRNTSKGMMLIRSDGTPSFAHLRLRIDDTFVWPWFSASIAGYVERENALYYTPDGWSMSFGTSPLDDRGETSWEEVYSLFPGGWYEMFDEELPALPGVAENLASIPPVPEWVGRVQAHHGFSDMNRLRRIVELTEDGEVMCLISNWGSWADYKVRDGLVGANGGFINGEELRDLIARIHAVSPRVKVGIYNLSLATTYESRIYAEHPDWFRSTNKEGDPAYFFPGMCANFATLLSNEAAFDEIVGQFGEIFDWLDVDFVYLDEPRAVNLIDWSSGEYNRDDLCYRFFAEMKQIAAARGPDKVIFFNARGNPYGDINFVEARSQLRAEFWREFAGMALGMEVFLRHRPGARIVPLYWTPPLARDYINRVLALGWIPSLTYGDVVARRPYTRAAWEQGNAEIIPLRYAPDWTRDPATSIESYPLRRIGDEAAILSLIHHGDEALETPLRIELASAGMAPGKPVYIWENKVLDAHETGGRATAALVREQYAAGRLIDRVVARRLVWSGPWREVVELPLRLEPLLLHQLVITQAPAMVYAVGEHPAQLLYPTLAGVAIRGDRVTCNADSADLLIPYEATATVDGATAPSSLVQLGGSLMTRLRVTRGEHRLELERTTALQPGKPVWDEAALPLVELPELGLTPEKSPRTEDRHETVAVGREVDGVMLRQATEYTLSTALNGYQPNLPGVMAEAEPDALRLTAGTTRKTDGFMAPAFAGFELDGARQVAVRLENSFHNAFHLRGAGNHTPMYKQSDRSFAGFVIDYHTPAGYTHRVLLGVGVLSAELSNPFPAYGKGDQPDRWLDLGDLVNTGPSTDLALDLARWAPAGWDGRVWFSVGADWIAADRRLTATLTGFNQAVAGPFAEGVDPRDFRAEFAKPKQVVIPPAPLAPILDGLPDDEMWQAAAELTRFYLVGGTGLPTAETRAKLMYDENHLYVGITCQEPVRRRPLIKGGPVWGDDEIEVWIDADGDGQTFRQLIVNAEGTSLGFDENGTLDWGAKVTSHIEPGKWWSVEVALPYRGLGLEPPKKGETWRLNVVRHRPAGQGFATELITWSPLQSGFSELPNLGTAVFR